MLINYIDIQQKEVNNKSTFWYVYISLQILMHYSYLYIYWMCQTGFWSRFYGAVKLFIKDLCYILCFYKVIYTKDWCNTILWKI